MYQLEFLAILVALLRFISSGDINSKNPKEVEIPWEGKIEQVKKKPELLQVEHFVKKISPYKDLQEVLVKKAKKVVSKNKLYVRIKVPLTVKRFPDRTCFMDMIVENFLAHEDPRYMRHKKPTLYTLDEKPLECKLNPKPLPWWKKPEKKGKIEKIKLQDEKQLLEPILRKMSVFHDVKEILWAMKATDDKTGITKYHVTYKVDRLKDEGYCQLEFFIDKKDFIPRIDERKDHTSCHF